MWSHQQVSLLISMYRENECLYKPKHPLYKNRNARNEALDQIKAAHLKLGLEVSILEIKNKWNNLRNNFLVQYRKYSTSIKSGTGDEEQEFDRPTLWYFDQMEFIREHSIPRNSEDSLSQATVDSQQENMEHDHQEIEECEREYEREMMNPQEEMSSTSGYLQLSEGENEERDNGLNSAKKIKIQSQYIIKEADLQSNLSCHTPISTATPRDILNKKRKRKTNQSEDEDFMKTATNALANLTNAFTIEQPALPVLPVVHTVVPKNSIQTFVEFVGSQLECLTSKKS